MIYLTVNDAPSGVYKSQVVDVVKELNQHLDQKVTLVALISFRNFAENKKKILDWYPSAKVVRMYPRLKYWQKNHLRLKRIKGIKTDTIIARGPMAFQLAAQLNANVVYDGRGAVNAELSEFPSMIPNPQIVKSIMDAEEMAVLRAKYRIAVSNQLVKYWIDKFGYYQNDHVVIPCTLSDSIEPDETKSTEILKELGWSQNDKILIYSGSTAGWQSFEKVSAHIRKWIEKQDVKVLFLSREAREIDALKKDFPDNVERRWLDHAQVANYLSVGDYGILIRDENVTNSVASPVKFAEYLMAGLKVLISPGIGDFSQAVEESDLGIVVKEGDIEFQKISSEDKKKQRHYAETNLTKKANREKFAALINIIK